MNRDSGTQILRVAIAATYAGDFEKAQRSIARVRRIDPEHPRLEAVAAQIIEAMNGGPEEDPAPASKAADTDGVRRRRRADPSATGSGPRAPTGGSSTVPQSPGSSGRAADAAQSAEVRRVLGTKDLYEVLRVERSATEAQVKRAYKLMARKIHPDRNPDPRAKEAFYRMQHAQDVLLDGDYRAYYDQHGEEEEVHQQQAQTQHANRVRRAYRRQQEPMDPFEQMFFGGGGGPFGFGGGGVQFGFMDGNGNVRFRNGRRGGAGGGNPGGGGPDDEHRARLASLLQLLPIILLLLFTLVPMLLSGMNSPNFSLDRQGSFAVPARTYDAVGVTPGLPYYVTREQYASLHTSRTERHRVEREVDGQLRDRLKSQCKQQRMRRHATIMQSERAWDRRTRDILRRQAEALTLDSCDLYDQYFSMKSQAARARKRYQRVKVGAGGSKPASGTAQGGGGGQGQAKGKGSTGRRRAT